LQKEMNLKTEKILLEKLQVSKNLDSKVDELGEAILMTIRDELEDIKSSIKAIMRIQKTIGRSGSQGEILTLGKEGE
jgi:hypothetical protein